MFDLYDENDYGGSPRYNWFLVQIIVVSFAAHVGKNFSDLEHTGVFVPVTNPPNFAHCAEANRQMCVLCCQLQLDLSPANCDEFDTVVASLQEEMKLHRYAMQHAAYRHLLSKL